MTWIRPARFASLYYWAVGNDQLAKGASVGSFAVLAAVAAAAAFATNIAFRRFDVR